MTRITRFHSMPAFLSNGHHAFTAMLQVLGSAIALLCTVVPAKAQIRQIPGLDSIKILEQSQNTYTYVFSKDSTQMTTHLTDAELSATPDFSGTVEEHYDVFYSDADGVANADGVDLPELLGAILGPLP